MSVPSPKESGDIIETETINAYPALEWVSDRTATWHDARTSTRLDPSRELPFVGVLLVEIDTPIEIKGCQYRTSNGSGSTPGRYYVKREAYEQLLEASGHYLFVVYQPRPGHPQLARILVPATIVDGLLEERWYDVDGSRSENEVAKLAWPHVIDSDDIESNGGRSL